MKQLLLVLSIVLMSCIIPYESPKDKCCTNVCLEYHGSNLHYAVWQGDDLQFNWTRCGCFLYPDDFEYNHTTPISTCQQTLSTDSGIGENK